MEIAPKDAPRAFKWNVNLQDMETKQYETIEVDLLEQEK